MNLILIVLTAALSFAVGFIAGMMYNGRPKGVAAVGKNINSEIMSEEYRNFLNYDGTVQV